ncbi:histidine--tRNA ligase [Mycoplasmopsis synoviae]|uniref:histidine--tRNA ligase n=1 Tax=Mycoplasmopsis synoviae TaxID=2109 RepID=UPI0034DB13EB
MKYQRVKGTQDYGVEKAFLKDAVESLFLKEVRLHGFEYVELPTLEHAQLFKNTVAQSDIGNKEMYEFLDKSQRELCLRPEMTANFVRAFVQNKWYAASAENKYAYVGKVFRYERPQKGRYREFTQAGVEFVGKADFLKDLYVITLVLRILAKLHIKYTLKLNYISNKETRKKYEETLHKYLLEYKDQLSEASQKRLETGNVFRVLDDKEDSQKDFVKNAPKLSDFYSEEDKEYVKNIKRGLDTYHGLEYQFDEQVVRGLDYYDDLVFEVSIKDSKAAQDVIIGGGRYSNLIKDLKGPETSSIGFAMGVDRVVDYLMDQEVYKEHLDKLETAHSENEYYFWAHPEASYKLSFFVWFFNLQLNEHISSSLLFDYDSPNRNKAFEKAKKLNSKAFVTLEEDNSLIVYDFKYGTKKDVDLKEQYHHLDFTSLLDSRHFDNLFDSNLFKPSPKELMCMCSAFRNRFGDSKALLKFAKQFHYSEDDMYFSDQKIKKSKRKSAKS